jgi:nicotinate-nucleotide adenylyltransferase
LIAFFGGTFDPIHLGHLHAARTVAALLRSKSVHLVLSAYPPLRDAPVAPLQDRWRMLVLATAGDPVLVADDRELRRGPPSYTVDTLEDIRAELGDAESICWCIGIDQYLALPRWQNPARILELAHLVVLERPGAPREPTSPELDSLVAGRVTNDPTMLSGSAGGVYLCTASMLPISATAIRAAIARSAPVAGLLPSEVATYIRQHRLYGDSGYP